MYQKQFDKQFELSKNDYSIDMVPELLLFAEKVEERDFFLKQARFKEICKVLDEYSETYNLVPCIKLLKLIKADLKAFEYFSKTSTEELWLKEGKNILERK